MKEVTSDFLNLHSNFRKSIPLHQNKRHVVIRVRETERGGVMYRQSDGVDRRIVKLLNCLSRF
jgi:hypothetical protein